MFRYFRIIPVFLLIAWSLLTAQDIHNASSMDDLRGHKVPKSLLNEISINLVDAPFELALEDISKKGDIKLSYNREHLPLKQKVSIQREGVFVVEALLDVLDQTKTALSITSNGTIIIVPNENARPAVENGQVTGYVEDVKTGDALPGANVWLEGTSFGSATNEKGEFIILNIPPGNYTIRANYIGYEDYKDTVNVKSAGKVFKIIGLKYSGAGESETIVVQAQASGQMQAINQQLSANELKNVVSKDRIRELPDQNAAESVGRLPGVSILREGGEGNKVVIRGLQPKYSKITVDGVELVATSSSDRSVSMNSISSYSLEGIEVIKAPTANMDGDQVGGTVNFKMRTAPNKLNYSIIAEGGYNDLKKTYNDYFLLGEISDRFFNNKLGIFAQITYDRKNLSSNQMHAGYELHTEDINKLNPLDTKSLTLEDNIKTRLRLGATFTLDYSIHNGSIYLKNFISSSNIDLQAYNERFERHHYYDTYNVNGKNLIYSNILNFEKEFSIIKVDAKAAHSFSEIKYPNKLEAEFRINNDVNTPPDGNWNIEPKEFWELAENRVEKGIWRTIKNSDDNLQGSQWMFSLDFQNNFVLSKFFSGNIQYGGKYRYETRHYDKEMWGGNMGSGNTSSIKDSILVAFPWMQDRIPLGTTQFPYELFIDKDFSHGDFLNGDYKLGPVADIDLMYDVLDVLYRSYHNFGSAEQQYSPFYYYGKSSHLDDYSGNENTIAAYLMAELNITRKIKFIPGVRYEKKETEYLGNRANNPEEYDFVPDDTTTTRKNEFFLPMIHLRYSPFNWLQIRLAYTQTLARPSYKYIIPRREIINSKNYLKTNNPYLKPERAESYDINIAFTNNYLGLFTIGGFYKNIKDKIYYENNKILNNPEYYDLPDIYKGYQYGAPENNSETSYVKGIEIDWQTNFWYLPSFLKGLILNINYTKIFSKAKYPKYEIKTDVNPTPPPFLISYAIDKSYWDRMQNQPDNVFNFAVGYDYKGFSTRFSAFYQDNIFISNNFWKEKRILTDDYLRFDLTIRQKLPWEGLQVYFNWVNLNNSYDRNYIFGNKRTTDIDIYGSLIRLGLRWEVN